LQQKPYCSITEISKSTYSRCLSVFEYCCWECECSQETRRRASCVFSCSSTQTPLWNLCGSGICTGIHL